MSSTSHLFAQNSASGAQAAATATSHATDYSGMYSFRRDGEFLQLTVGDDGSLTGFVSRYGDLDSDRGVFINQFFKKAKLEGANVSFVTSVVHGAYFEFKGTIQRGDAKAAGDEGYYVLKGTLTENSSTTDNHPVSKTQDVTFRSFPRDLSSQ